MLNSLMHNDVGTEVSLQNGAVVCMSCSGLFALSLVSSADLASPLLGKMQLSAARRGPMPASHTGCPCHLSQSPRPRLLLFGAHPPPPCPPTT